MSIRLEKSKSRNSERGFSLAETMVAVGILALVATGVAQLFGVAAEANMTSKTQTTAVTLAAEKMEQLRSLTWGFDSTGLGLPVSDTTTDLSTSPPSNTGNGLNPSPSNALTDNVPGYFDYLRADGSWAGNQDGGLGYIRRWSITPLPTNPNNTLIFQVFVTTHERDHYRKLANTGGPMRLQAGEAWLISVKTRKAGQ